MIRTCIELIDASNPIQTRPGEIIEGDQVVVARDTMYRANAHFMESLKEVLRNVDRRFEILHPNIRHFDNSRIGRNMSIERGWFEEVERIEALERCMTSTAQSIVCKDVRRKTDEEKTAFEM